MICEETAAILCGENSSETPFITLECSHLEHVHDKDLAWLGTAHPDRTIQNLYNLQIEISNILRIVVVLDLPIGPVVALDPEDVAWID